MTRPLVVGLGGRHGDDEAGWLVIQRLQELGYAHDRLFRARHPAEVLDVIDANTELIICDACRGAGAPGMFLQLHWPTDQLVYARPNSSHEFSLSDTLELGAQLDSGPRMVEIWAIEGEVWCAGAEVSPVVRAAATQVAELIWDARCDS
ncbi:hydrogenase maturation protease [Schlesneria paludicola]|uniref:hydrogenase maturation protease n=1 Tax=Schlesneria paludicola TaxID=360056 RepID=UPI00029AA227|nr:hydrogenase maturation protease [Schlesneria paludicola]